MPSPALIVGLGGTGTLAATYIKKELMETSGGTWPLKEVKVLAFDTDEKQPSIGAQGQIREAGRSTGAVRLSTGEFFFTGGNVQALMREVARGKHPHLGKWLLADYYLRNLPDKMFNLNEGAGQFRQFGRLAVFKDVATPANSTIYNTLNDALRKLQRDNPDMGNLQVFVIGSLAGGTGAGMFADIAYLIRKIAEQTSLDIKKKMSLRGYLVLPGAFSSTVNSEWMHSMNARAFAAMRENRRFTVSFDYQRGYPMHYHESGGDVFWHGSLKGRLFDLLYYIDGKGLNDTDIEHGTAPMIADAITAAIDREGGAAFASYVANVEAERTNRIARGELSEKTAVFGGVGTYSIVFPIYQIVEGWTHALGLEILDTLLHPTQKDPRTGVPVAFASNTNQENPGEDGAEAAAKFLRATTPVTYQTYDRHGNLRTEMAEPTLLFGEFARIAALAKASNKQSRLQELMARGIEEWKPHFMPHGEDKETRRLIRRVEQTIESQLYDKDGELGTVLASNQMKPKEDPLMGSERIIDETRNYKARLLGDEDPRTGQRFGGRYRDALSEISEYQAARFQRYLDAYIQATLNGAPTHTGREARGGKIGFLAAFLTELYERLVRTQEVLQQVQQARRERGESRRTALAETQRTLQHMKTLAGKRNLLGRPAGEAYQAQHAYLRAESRLIDILETEAVEDALLETVTLLIGYVHSAREAVLAWLQTLGKGERSLYADLLRGRDQVNSDRKAEKSIKSRFVLEDEEYERERYEHYLSTIEGGWQEKILRSVTWEIRTRQQGGRPKLELALKVDVEDSSRQLAHRRGVENLTAWLHMCRKPFADARSTESVVGYLLRHEEYRNPDRIATLLHQHGGIALSVLKGNPLPANFLRAYFQSEEEAGHRAYLGKVIQELAQLQGQRTDSARDEENESRFVKFTNSEDRFKFTVVFTQELIELENIATYADGNLAYLGNGGRGDRRILHIFPAEVHAAEYEARLPELRQEIRLFSDGVALQLEDVQQFRLFLMCYTYGMVRRVPERDPETHTTRFVFKLFIPPAQETDAYGNPLEPEEIWLTPPKKEIYMLDAITTFNFVGRDVGHGENYVQEIDYRAVSAALQRERERDAARRVQEMKFAYNKGLLTSIQAIQDEGERLAALMELARIERVMATRDKFKKEILPYYKKLLPDPHAQDDYDLTSVFWMMLDDEVKAVQQVLTDKIRALRDLGVIADNS